MNSCWRSTVHSSARFKSAWKSTVSSAARDHVLHTLGKPPTALQSQELFNSTFSAEYTNNGQRIRVTSHEDDSWTYNAIHGTLHTVCPACFLLLSLESC
jgi:hypothetical protein